MKCALCVKLPVAFEMAWTWSISSWPLICISLKQVCLRTMGQSVSWSEPWRGRGGVIPLRRLGLSKREPSQLFAFSLFLGSLWMSQSSVDLVHLHATWPSPTLPDLCVATAAWHRPLLLLPLFSATLSALRNRAVIVNENYNTRKLFNKLWNIHKIYTKKKHN